MDWTKEHGERIKEMGKQVMVVQGTVDKVIHEDVPSTIQKAVGEELCEVKWLEGYGHAGAPENAKGYIAGAAAKTVAEFLNYSKRD